MVTFNKDKFVQTNKYITITFGGWDGKSYNGESCKMRVFTHPDFPEKKFVRTWIGRKTRIYHEVEDRLHTVSGVPTVFVKEIVNAD